MDHSEIIQAVKQIKVLDIIINDRSEAVTPPLSITVRDHRRTRRQLDRDREAQLKNRMMELYVDLKCKIINHPDKVNLARCFNDALGSEIIK